MAALMVAGLAGGLSPMVQGPMPAAAATCDRYAAASGAAGNPGTAASPVQTIRQLANLLAPGQTGCLKPGDTFVSPGDGSGAIVKSGAPGSPITLTSGPGTGRATLRGQFQIDGSHVVLRELNFAGYQGPVVNFKNYHLLALGDNVEIRNNDITSDYGICVGGGSVDSDTRADNLVIDGNRIHGCGRLNTFVPRDSGSHGIYIVYTFNARITNNYVYDNRVRGVQLYPATDQTLVANNVIDGNSGNVNIGWEPKEDNGVADYYPRNSIVENNIITNATFQGNNKDTGMIQGNYPSGTAQDQYGNVVRFNCVWIADPALRSKYYDGLGFRLQGNIEADPLYTNLAAKDFSLRAGSPCAGKGPASVTPTTTALTVVNLTESGETLRNTCFRVYPVGVTPGDDNFLFDRCDGQDGQQDGRITFTLAPGEYRLYQTDATGFELILDQRVTVGNGPTQEVTVRNRPLTTSPSLALDKVSSKFNGVVTATLTGFTPNSPVTLRWPQRFPINATDPPSTNLLVSGTTDAQGRATLRFRTPLQPFVNAGYVVTARDGAGKVATDTLRVIPRILLNEDQGTRATRLRVYFYGFAPGERIEVRWHTGATNASSYAVLFTLTVAENGRAVSRAFSPPAGALGDHLVVGKVIGVSRSASDRFELLAGGGAVDDTTPTATASATPTPDVTATPEPTSRATSTPAPTATAVPTETPTPEPAPTETPTPEPTATATPVPDASPVADAGGDATVTDEDSTGDELVDLDGRRSSDPEGEPLRYVWTVAGSVVATEPTATVLLPVGTTVVTLTVTDAAGQSAVDEVLITVQAEETADDPVDGDDA